MKPNPSDYFAAVVDTTTGCRCASIRSSAEQVLQVPLTGNNPRIVRIPCNILQDEAAILRAIQRSDDLHFSVRLGAPHG
jgi:hypothetical protein